MSLNKKEQATVFDQSVDFETSLGVMAAKSEHRAWMLTGISWVFTALTLITLMLLMPLKTVVPYMVQVNETTGQTQLLSVLDQTTLTEQEALNKYWLANYLRWRESYDWYTLPKEYPLTLAFSAPTVASEFVAIYEGADALDAKWGRNIKATVKILSIITQPDSDIATLRFEKTIKGVNDRKGETHVWVATIAYQYKSQEALSEEDRLINPVGFQVISYRVHPEYVQ